MSVTLTFDFSGTEFHWFSGEHMTHVAFGFGALMWSSIDLEDALGHQMMMALFGARVLTIADEAEGKADICLGDVWGELAEKADDRSVLEWVDDGIGRMDEFDYLEASRE